MGASIFFRMAKSKAVRIGSILLCIVIGVGIVRSVYRLSQKRDILTTQEETLARLETKNQQLKNELREATSAAFIERTARNTLGLVREGETVIIMNKPESKTTIQEKTRSNWQQWWELFF